MPTLVLQSTCPHCQNQYDGRRVPIGQEIECPLCEEKLPHQPMLGKFMLLKQLGQGGVCTVYLARDTKSNQEVALKLLKKSLSKDSDSILRFFDEAETTEIFKHPNVVEVYEFGEHAGTLYLSMEYLNGGTLDDLMEKQGGLDELKVLEVGIEAASGLAHAAARGVVHRDVKPGNIIFKATGEATVTDFGLSQKETDPNPNTDEVWGTAYYVPPERLRGEPEDFRSDMYGLAASLYHALTGRPAFAGTNLEEIVVAQDKGLVHIRSVRQEISKRTALVIEKAMSIRPVDRYASYEAFIEALEAARSSFLKRNWRQHFLSRAYLELASKKVSIYFFSILFGLSGILHFITPDPFVDIVPGYLPFHLLLVQISGFLEILGGLGVLWPRTRVLAGYGLLLLLLAVFPANVYMLTDHPYILTTRIPTPILFLRLPLQFVLMAWIHWATRKK